MMSVGGGGSVVGGGAITTGVGVGGRFGNVNSPVVGSYPKIGCVPGARTGGPTGSETRSK